MASHVGRTTLSAKDNNKLGLSQQGNYSPRRPVRNLRAPYTPDVAKDRKNRFSLGRLLPTPRKEILSSQKPNHRQQRKIDDESVTSEDIYLTSEEEFSNSAVSSCNKEGPKTVATLMTGSSSLESQKAQDNVENSRPHSPTFSSSPSSSSTLPSIKEVIESNAEASYKKRNTSENSQVQYYRKIVQNRVSHYGKRDIRTAESYMELGNAQLKFNEFQAAGKSFLSALKTYQAIYGDRHLSVARALSKLALAACNANKNLDLVIVALSDALKIRIEILGPTHVDSIDTLDEIAAVRLSMRSCVRAALDYLTVFNHRAHVFGRNHESVATTSYTLGGILCDMLDMKEDAEDFFKLSLQIYEALGIDESPNVPDIRQRLGINEGEEIEFDGYLFVNSSNDELEGKLRARMRKSCPVEI